MRLWRGGEQVKVNSYLDERGLQPNALFAQILQALTALQAKYDVQCKGREGGGVRLFYGLDDNAASIRDVDVQVVAVQHPHTDERSRIDSVGQDHYRFIGGVHHAFYHSALRMGRPPK